MNEKFKILISQIKNSIFSRIISSKDWSFISNLIVYSNIYQKIIFASTLISAIFICRQLYFLDIWAFCFDLSESKADSIIKSKIPKTFKAILTTYAAIRNPYLIEQIASSFLEHLSARKGDQMFINNEGYLYIGIEESDVTSFLETVENTVGYEVKGMGSELTMETKIGFTKKIIGNLYEHKVIIVTEADRDKYLRIQGTIRQDLRDGIVTSLKNQYNTPSKFPIFDLYDVKTIMTSRTTWYMVGAVAVCGVGIGLYCTDFPIESWIQTRIPKSPN